MALRLFSSKIAKVLVVIILIVALIYFLYWLWQRQPKNITEEKKRRAAAEQVQKSDSGQITISTSPQDGQILDSNDVKVQIKTSPNLYTAIYSNDFANISKSDQAGKVEKQLKLNDGLNLIKISVIANDLGKDNDAQIALFVKNAKKPTNAQTAVAGTVKNIFQNLITIETLSGEKKVKTSDATKINSPSPSPAKTPVNKSPFPKTTSLDIRVGDFIVALGNRKNSDEVEVESIDVMRNNKPTIISQVAPVKLLTKIKDNLFSATNEKDSKIVEFTLTKTSQIEDSTKQLEQAAIEKDRRAIIIFHNQDDKQNVDLVYLLP